MGFSGQHTNCLVCVRTRKAQRCTSLRANIVSRKASTASPACRKTPSGVLPEGNPPVLGKFEKAPEKVLF